MCFFTQVPFEYPGFTIQTSPLKHDPLSGPLALAGPFCVLFHPRLRPLSPLFFLLNSTRPRRRSCWDSSIHNGLVLCEFSPPVPLFCSTPSYFALPHQRSSVLSRCLTLRNSSFNHVPKPSPFFPHHSFPQASESPTSLFPYTGV